MSLSGSLSIAAGGLANISSQFAVLSQNVANVGTPSYAQEVTAQYSVSADGQGLGVATGPTQRDIDAQLQASVLTGNAQVSALTVTQTALQQIDAAQGTPGAGTDLSTMLGNLTDAFSTLQDDPSNQTQQQAVVSAASALTTQINSLASAIGTTRQAAQDDLGEEVTALNQSLASVGSLNQQIVAAQAQGLSTADLQNQRDAALATLSNLLPVRVLTQPNGNDLLVTDSGLSLPTTASATAPSGPFTIAQATLGAQSYYPGGTAPPVLLNGADVTAQLDGGSIGANLTLRDGTLPTFQGELDEFSETLASRFAQQGLVLFTDPAGNLPTATGAGPAQTGYVGFSGDIQVNPAVLADAAQVRDGNATVAGSATGASAFTPNPSGGPAGYSGLITRVLTYALGSQAQTGVTWTAPLTAGLGASGTLAAPFSAPADLGDFATDIVAAEAEDSASASSQLTTAAGVQTSLATQVSATSGVSLDTQMSNMIALQNAYAANAKIISAVQALWQQLDQMVG